MDFQVAEAVELIKVLAETENLTLQDAFRTFVAEAGLDVEYASVLKGALFETVTLEEMAQDALSKALYNVFVKGVSAEDELQESETKETQEGTKYKVRVKDRQSGSSYVRYATRAKIAELRANPNIASVEMTDYGTTGEDDRGEKTASAKRGGDYDGDGKRESSSKEHAGVVHNAIQRKMGGKPDGQDTRKEAFDPKGARRMDAAKGKKAETEDEKNKRLMLGKYSPAVKYAKTRKEDVEYVDEVSKELATKAYAERRTNEFEADELNTKSDKTRERIVKKHGEKAGEDADKAAEKKIYGEGIDFKGAKRIDDARAKKQAEKDKKSPSSKDYRLAMGKFRPGASNKERAEGGRDVMREKGTSPTKKGKKMFEAYLEARAALKESQLRHRDAKTGEVTDKPVPGRTYYTDGDRQESSVARRKREAAEKAKKKVSEGLDMWKPDGEAGSDDKNAKMRGKEDKKKLGMPPMLDIVKKNSGKTQKEEWKPDPKEKREKKAKALHDREQVAISQKGTKYETPKTEDPDKLYKRRQAIQSKTKMRKEDFVMEADLMDAGRENSFERETVKNGKKVDGKGVDNSTRVKLMPYMREDSVVTGKETVSEMRLSGGETNEGLRSLIRNIGEALSEECCDKCGTPECTCESKEKEDEKPKKKKAKLDEAGMPIFETKAESRNNARPGPSKDMIDPPADPLGPPGHMNPKGEPKRYKEAGEAPGDRRPNRKKDKSLPNEDGTVPNGAGV